MGLSGACMLDKDSALKKKNLNTPCQVIGLVFVLHVVHLVGDALKPVLRCFNTRDHGSNLGTDYSL